MNSLVKVKDAEKLLKASNFIIPNYKHINPKIKITIKYIKFSEIDYSIGKNRGRDEKRPTSKRINSTKRDFAPGIRLSEFLPSVIVKNVSSSSTKIYELFYGYGRLFAFIELGCAGYWYYVIENATEDDLEWIAQDENWDVFKAPNKEFELVNAIHRMIERGTVLRTKKGIVNKIEQKLPWCTSPVIERVYSKIKAKVKIREDFVTYSESTILDWLKDNSKEEYVIKGKYDHNRKMFGHSFSSGRVKDIFDTAIMEYVKSGISSYGLVHFSEPTRKLSIKKKRQNFSRILEERYTSYEKVGIKNIREIVVILGALPQEWGVDDWKVLVQLKKYNPPASIFHIVNDKIIDGQMPEISKKIEEKIKEVA
jgi:hypothetical protein